MQTIRSKQVLLGLSVTVLAAFLLCAVSLGRPLLDVGWYLVLHRESPRYNYSGYSSQLPSQPRPGETLSTAWRSYVHIRKKRLLGGRYQLYYAHCW